MRGGNDSSGTRLASDSLPVLVWFLPADSCAMIKVLVAENIRLLREALVTLLRLEGDIDVVAAVGTGDAIVPAAIRRRPDIAIIEIFVPHRDGLDAAVELRRRLPECKVLILTGSC